MLRRMPALIRNRSTYWRRVLANHIYRCSLLRQWMKIYRCKRILPHQLTRRHKHNQCDRNKPILSAFSIAFFVLMPQPQSDQLLAAFVGCWRFQSYPFHFCNQPYTSLNPYTRRYSLLLLCWHDHRRSVVFLIQLPAHIVHLEIVACLSPQTYL